MAWAWQRRRWGVLRRVVVIDLDEDGILELVNPTIIHTEGEQDGVEGCLSVPGKWGMVKRPESVTVEAKIAMASGSRSPVRS